MNANEEMPDLAQWFSPRSLSLGWSRTDPGPIRAARGRSASRQDDTRRGLKLRATGTDWPADHA